MRFFIMAIFFSVFAQANSDICEYCGEQSNKSFEQHTFNENLDGSNFTGAVLNQVLFLAPSKEFSARNVKFDYADLQKSRFSKPGDGEIFRGSSWRGVDFRYGFLKEAGFLEKEKVGIALIDNKTQLPKDFKKVRDGNAFLNVDMLGDFELDPNSDNDQCFLGLCFKRHALFKKNFFSVELIDVGKDPRIVLRAGGKKVEARIAKNVAKFNVELRELRDRGMKDLYPMTLNKGARAILGKDSNGDVFLKVFQKVKNASFSRTFKKVKNGYFRRSLKDKNIIFGSFAAWKNDSGDLDKDGPMRAGLDGTFDPEAYVKKQSGSELNVALVYYGDFWREEDLNRIEDILERRFSIATDDSVRLNVVYKEVLDFRHKIENFPNYVNGKIKDKKRLERLWYYDHLGGHVLTEAYYEFKKTSKGRKHYRDLDAILLITGAQFESLAFQIGKIAAIEQPREVAWSNGGRTVVVSDEEIVDGLIHELGHTMFLGHASSQCWKPGSSLEEKRACCAQSAAKDDVMSYCRNRKIENEEMINRFASCNLDMIKNKVAPAIMSGGSSQIKNRSRCE